LRSKLQVEFLRKYRLSETVDISRAVLTVRWNVTLIISGARALTVISADVWFDDRVTG